MSAQVCVQAQPLPTSQSVSTILYSLNGFHFLGVASNRHKAYDAVHLTSLIQAFCDTSEDLDRADAVCVSNTFVLPCYKKPVPAAVKTSSPILQA